MVVRLIVLLCTLPVLLFSGEFKATVNSRQVDLRQGVTLTLTLKEATVNGSPTIEGLQESFFIASQQQMSNAMLNNGRISMSVSWKYNLLPKGEGEVTIPSISIDTSEGVLLSDPIVISVSAKAASANPGDANEAVLTADVSKANPYKNEPVFYTVRLTSRHELLNVSVQPLQVDDAIVEPNGEPKINKTMVDGLRVNVVDISYLISPLKTGPLKIPSITIQGAIPVKRKTGSPFDDNFEPFFLVHGFDQLKPFAYTTKEIILDVQPTVLGVNPWLPARSLKLEEIWDPSQVLQVGEPITRGFKISAEGVMSSQLPSLNEQQTRDEGFKTYADKPEVSEEISGGMVRSMRKEQYALIPQQAGEMTLPEISVVWWDTVINEKLYARIPSRTFHILPAPETNKQLDQVAEERAGGVVAQSVAVARDPLFYGLVVGLGILLLAAIFWAIALQRKVERLTDKHKQRPANQKKTEASKKPPPVKLPEKEKREKLPDLNPT